MRFEVDPRVFDHFPGMILAVAIARGLDNTGEHRSIRESWMAAWAGAQAARTFGNSQSHPRVKPWRDRMQALGASGKKFPSSIEALLRRALKGGEPFFINPLVDFYNAVSLRHVVPAGGFDLAGTSGDLALRFSSAGDHFQALDEQAPELIPAGELSYANGRVILTRHFVWRQARAGLIVPTTRDVFLVSEVLGELGPAVAAEVLSELRQGLRTYFQVEPAVFLLDAEHPAIEW